MLRVSVETLIRNQVGSILAIAVCAFVVDAMLFASLPSLGRYLPGEDSDALAGLPTAHLIAAGHGAAVCLAWTLAFLATAPSATITAPRDVTDGDLIGYRLRNHELL